MSEGGSAVDTPGNRRQKSSRKQALSADADPIQEVLWARPGFLVRRLNQIHYALFAEECEACNMTPVQFGVLTALSLNHWMDQTAIGRELGLDRTTTADVLKRLEEKNLITRRVSPSDRRSRQSKITAEGRRVMRSLHAGMMAAQRRLLAPLSLRNQAVFVKLLSALVDANNEYSRAPTRAAL
jgi:DNA-binding MarR family transcriptional regulator